MCLCFSFGLMVVGSDKDNWIMFAADLSYRFTISQGIKDLRYMPKVTGDDSVEHMPI